VAVRPAAGNRRRPLPTVALVLWLMLLGLGVLLVVRHEDPARAIEPAALRQLAFVGGAADLPPPGA
jgi:hypothetical protein